MKILKILGIAAGIHALALVLLLTSPGCSSSKAQAPEASPISDAPAPAASSATIQMPDSAAIRYSPTRPGTTVAGALAAQPVSDVTPASTYTVAHGDTLSSVARKNGLSKAELAAANSLRTGSVLRLGQKLVIPAKAHAAEAEAAPPKAEEAAPARAEAPSDATRHVVKPGETLGGIARKYGVKQGDIAVANNITDPRRIHPGQELVIPSKTASGARTVKAAPAKAAAPAADQDLDAGLKQPSAGDVPAVKVDDVTPSALPKNP